MLGLGLLGLKRRPRSKRHYLKGEGAAIHLLLPPRLTAVDYSTLKIINSKIVVFNFGKNSKALT